LAATEPPVAVNKICTLCSDPVIVVSIAKISFPAVGDVHESREYHCYAADVNEISEQAILAKDALSLVKQTGYNRSGSNSVNVWHNVRDWEFLGASQQIVARIEEETTLAISRSAK